MSRSPDEIRQQIAKLNDELAKAEAEELEADHEQLIALLIKFEKHKKLPDNLVELLSTKGEKGKFAPAVFIRKPRV